MLNLFKHWITGAVFGLTLPVFSIYAADESVAYAPGLEWDSHRWPDDLE